MSAAAGSITASSSVSISRNRLPLQNCRLFVLIAGELILGDVNLCQVNVKRCREAGKKDKGHKGQQGQQGQGTTPVLAVLAVLYVLLSFALNPCYG